MTDSVLELDHLARAFGETRALTAFTLRANSGTVHSVLGENGSGKSTAVKILSGVLTPDRGGVTILGQQVRKFTPAAARALGIATVFQELLNVPTRSVLDNVLLGEPGFVRPRYNRRQRIAAAEAQLTRLGLGGVPLDVPVANLPLSIQQLVAVARALVREPKMLILDESTSALDVEARDRLFEVIRQELTRDVLVLFITHRIDEIVHLADAVTVLSNGATVATLEGPDINETNLLGAMSAAGVSTRA